MGWNDQVIAEFRANNGRVGGMFEGAQLLLLTTAGRRSGRPHTNPAVYRRDGAAYVVFASNAGSDKEPDWFRNILASPQVTLELGTDEGRALPFAARAVPLAGAERDRLWEAQCADDPAFRAYERKTSRTIAVVALHLLDLAADPGVGPAVVRQLLGHHDDLRAQLARLRAALDAGEEAAPAALAEQLRDHCLTYCYGLHLHHTREEGAFTQFERRYPALVPAIARLRAEHGRVTEALAAFEAELTADGAAPDVARLRAGLERLVTGLEDHFAYEEKELLAAVS
ncbi:nitroreductase/quinone reductase family protein [Streptomyces avicenniae]|uniref:nitroreductase/quinone reductase family protein n=1 Tax=Streptomyces avicenniae TaxID=500153 RepID=UPI00069AA013|nr:nitroreductase/quinone reductase family protein [Streptomyces avicenniae]